jgi:hypothetical protein
MREENPIKKKFGKIGIIHKFFDRLGNHRRQLKKTQPLILKKYTLDCQ